jgi:hypothetical protein
MAAWSKTTEPLSGASSPRTIRPVVDFPEPDSPTRPSVSPRWMSNETPSTARTSMTRPNMPARMR